MPQYDEEEMYRFASQQVKDEWDGRWSCPECGGPIAKHGVKTCVHCRKELFWAADVVSTESHRQATDLEDKIAAARNFDPIKRKYEAEHAARVKEGLSEYSSGMILGGVLWLGGFLVGMPGLMMIESGGWFFGFIGGLWCLVTYGVGIIGLGVLLWNLGCLIVKAGSG